MDISLATGAFVMTLPVQAVVAVAILRKMGSPILFRQQRPGLHGRPFTLIKFRTMREGSCARSAPASDADRLTPLGKRLRSMSVDELPELWNVLQGDMSLVGPRPLLMEYLPRYSRAESRRHEVRPGITGWAQVNGRNDIHWDERFALDIWYVDHVSFWLDIRILWRTLVSVATRRGISAPGHETMSEFRPEA